MAGAVVRGVPWVAGAVVRGVTAGTPVTVLPSVVRAGLGRTAAIGFSLPEVQHNFIA